MHTAHKRRLLGAGAIVSWTVVICLGGATSVRSVQEERYEWLFLALVGVACVLAVIGGLIYLVDRRLPDVPGPPRATRDDDGGDDKDQIRKSIAVALENLTDAIHAEGFDIKIPDHQYRDLCEACDAPLGSEPREVRIDLLGETVYRTVTPGSDPDWLLYELTEEIVTYPRRIRNAQYPQTPRRASQSPSRPRGRAPQARR